MRNVDRGYRKNQKLTEEQAKRAEKLGILGREITGQEIGMAGFGFPQEEYDKAMDVFYEILRDINTEIQK